MTNDQAQMPNKSLNQESGKKYDIKDRAVEFAIRSAKLAGNMRKTQASVEYCKQLIRSSASIGTNFEEADGTLSINLA